MGSRSPIEADLDAALAIGVVDVTTFERDVHHLTGIPDGGAPANA